MATKKKSIQPTWPYPGTYDPTFAINVDQANLGFQRFQNDFARDWGELGAGASGGRNANDLATALARNNTQTGWGRADIERDYSRSLADLLRQRGYASDDYKQNIAGLKRDYQRLGNQQSQAMRAAGVSRGGATAQAARKRAENLAWDRKPIDTGYNRYITESGSQQNRLGEDRATGLERLNTQSQWGNDDLNLTYSRGREDALSQYGRNFLDNENYRNNMGALAYYSSQGVQPAGLSIYELLRRRAG